VHRDRRSPAALVRRHPNSIKEGAASDCGAVCFCRTALSPKREAAPVIGSTGAAVEGVQAYLPPRPLADAPFQGVSIMTKRSFVATAAAVFAAGALATAANAQTVKCSGANACKGTSACKSGQSACKGQNACKGQGWTEAANAGECTTKGGKVM
jgi:hypothetical protein